MYQHVRRVRKLPKTGILTTKTPNNTEASVTLWLANIIWRRQNTNEQVYSTAETAATKEKPKYSQHKNTSQRHSSHLKWTDIISNPVSAVSGSWTLVLVLRHYEKLLVLQPKRLAHKWVQDNWNSKREALRTVVANGTINQTQFTAQIRRTLNPA